LILDRDLPQEESSLGISRNPEDVDEASEFTLEAKLVRLSNLVREGEASRADLPSVYGEIRRRMEQAKEVRDKLSERGAVAFDYLQSTKDRWDGGGSSS